jgi:hypothetical protein
MWHILINTIIIPLAIVILPACKLHTYGQSQSNSMETNCKADTTPFNNFITKFSITNTP